jgi:NTE family protein
MIEFLSRAFGGGNSEKPKGTKPVNLALQGGGAYGAFTWGVLDHLLNDGRLTIEGISGTSAGAVNAVMLADGMRRGGAGEARKHRCNVPCSTGCSHSCLPMVRHSTG